MEVVGIAVGRAVPTRKAPGLRNAIAVAIEVVAAFVPKVVVFFWASIGRHFAIRPTRVGTLRIDASWAPVLPRIDRPVRWIDHPRVRIPGSGIRARRCRVHVLVMGASTSNAEECERD
jgi:hypothetical protein